MEQKKSKKRQSVYSGIVLKLLLCLSLSGCAGIKLKDDPICYEFSPDRGRCVRIVSGEEFVIDYEHKYEGKTWWEIRPTLMQVPPQTWANLKDMIIKVCKKYRDICDDEVASWDRTVQTVDDTAKTKAP